MLKETFFWGLLSIFGDDFGRVNNADATSINSLRSEISCFFGHHVSFDLGLCVVVVNWRFWACDSRLLLADDIWLVLVGSLAVLGTGKISMAETGSFFMLLLFWLRALWIIFVLSNGLYYTLNGIWIWLSALHLRQTLLWFLGARHLHLIINLLIAFDSHSYFFLLIFLRRRFLQYVFLVDLNHFGLS